MKFHNQRSFMGHEISNVNNKPLLHKKGKQWIVVAVSALILAGFGGMVSTTTHADTTAQPTTTKVALKPANTPAKATTPVSNTTSNTKSSVASSASSSSKSTTPEVNQSNTKKISQQANQLHMNLLQNAPTTPAVHTIQIQTTGKWNNSNDVTWTLTNGNLLIQGHNSNSNNNKLTRTSDGLGYDLMRSLGLSTNGAHGETYTPNQKATARSVKTLSFNNVSVDDCHRLFDDEEFTPSQNNPDHCFANLTTIDLSGLNMSSATSYWAMFGGLKGLTSVVGLKNLPSDAGVNWLFCDDPSLVNVDLSQTKYLPNDSEMFLNDPKLQAIALGPHEHIDKAAFVVGNSAVPSDQINWHDSSTKANLNNNDNLSDDSPTASDTWTSSDAKPKSYTDTINYINSKNGKVINTTQLNSNIFNSSEQFNVQVPTGWSIDTSKSKKLPTSVKLNGSIYNIYILPNLATDTVDYKYENASEGSTTMTGNFVNDQSASDTSFTIGATPAGLSNGYIVSNPNQSYNYNNSTIDVPVQLKEDYLNYVDMTNSNHLVNRTPSDISIKTTGEGIINNNNTFTITKDYSQSLPAGYHIDHGDGISNDGLTFSHQNGSHQVYVAPDKDCVSYKYDNQTLGTQNGFNFNPSNSSVTTFTVNKSNDSNIPKGYQLVNSTNTFKFNNSNHDVYITPIQETDIIDYMNGDMKSTSSVSSSTFVGNDVAASGASNTNFTVTSAPANYHIASNATTTFNYDGGTHTVPVVPNTITINYMSGNNKVGSYSANTMTPYTVFNSDMDSASAGSLPASSVAADVNLPAGYSLVNSNSSLSFDNGSYNISVTPDTKTDTINYMYNRTEVSSAKVSGENMYAKYSAFNVSTAPAGYSAVSSNFYYDGEPHDVNIKPNEDTDTVNYQVNGSTVASYQFTGNDEHATRAGDNSFDANDDIPSGYEPVNNDNNFGFDNGTHDVAIQPIPQPAPFIPSMPVSSVASVSSANSESTVPASNTISQPSNEIKPIHRSHYSHYRYAKVITPLQLHTSKHFTKKNGVLTIKHPTSFKIMKIVHDHKYTRYEVKYQGHKYFITGNSKFTINDYVQKHDFKSHKHMMVKVITPMIEYKHAHFSRKYAIRVFKKGAVLPVKRVFTIGKGEMTRFELTNGRYVTSNKLFVKVIK